MSESRHQLRKEWLAPLIHAQMATGNFARLVKDAIAHATVNRRWDDVRLYKNMLDQISDYYAQIGSEDLG